MEYLSWLLTLMFLQCCLTVDDETEYNEGFVGCFNDDAYDQDFPWWNNNQNLDPILCRMNCEDNAFIYFGFSGPKGSDCYCGNSGLVRKKVDVSKCQMCSQNGYKFRCGSLHKIAVYKTKASLAVDRRYAGCWKGGENVFPDRARVTEKLSALPVIVAECLSICHQLENGKFLFVGIIGEKRCICGVRPEPKGRERIPVLAEKCDIRCKGFKNNSRCGSSISDDIISIYRNDQYIGCYKANMTDQTLSFWHWPEPRAPYASKSCISQCQAFKFKFAALTAGDEHRCYCGNYGMELIFGGYSEACPENCVRNGETFHCAPPEAIAVYDTFVFDVPDERYMACYCGDVYSLMGDYFNAGQTRKKEECISRCRANNRHYVARWNNFACYCGNAIFNVNNGIRRVKGEEDCNHLVIYWAGCPTRGQYKKDCTGICNCHNYDICDPYSGTCPDLKCAAAFTKDATDTSIFKDSCQKFCSVRGKYGPGCQEDCNCYNNGDCDFFTGECYSNQCTEGMRMDDHQRCTRECEVNHFGLDCAFKCFCDGEDCNKADGTCPSGVCKRGYSSSRCDVIVVDNLYIGCFNDDPEERVFFWWPEVLVEHTAKDCVNICFKHDFKYAGLSEEGTVNECFCGNFGFENMGVSTKCTTCTNGTETFPCAPSDSIAVFTTYGSGEPDPRFMGCWAAPPQIIDPATQPIFRYPKTAISCVDKCRGNNFKYAAILDGRECYCGNDLQRHIQWKTSNTACSTLCEGSGTFSPTCGGPSSVSVYRAVIHTEFKEDFVGCFSNDDPNDRSFRWWHDNHDLDPTQCRKKCEENDFIYFGFTGPQVSRGPDCFCGNAGLVRNIVDVKQCRICVRNGYTFRCGKQNVRMAVFKTKARLAVDPRYVGCWSGGESVFPDRVDVTDRLTVNPVTVTECHKKCGPGSYLFFGIIRALRCICGVKPVPEEPTRIPILAKNCNTSCHGIGHLSPCGSSGSYDTISIYRLDQYNGCYGANMTDYTYSFWHWPVDHKFVTAANCIQRCRWNNFKYSALTAGDEHRCFCGNYGMELRFGGYSEACPGKCIRNGYVFFCAPHEAIAVYDNLRDLSDDRFMACYSGDPAIILEAVLKVNDTTDKELCFAKCREYNRHYAVRVNNTACYCSNAVYHQNGSLERGWGESACNDLRLYWAACPTRGQYKKDCNGMCNCVNYQICNPSTGICPDQKCASGFTKDATDTSIFKDSCQKSCKDLKKYGLDCQGGSCNCYADGVCDPLTGVCDSNRCQVGMMKDDQNRCTKECAVNRYGQDCSFRCFCDREDCNKVDGNCPSRVCKKGYSSDRCNIPNIDELYVGCFNDDPEERVFFWWPEELLEHTAKDCVNLCFDHKFKYAGLSKEGTVNKCFCGNFGFEGRGYSSKCTSCTNGNEVFPCAPSDSIAVFVAYGTGDTDPRFMACWVAQPQIIDPATVSIMSNPKTVVMCIDECRTNNFLYSAIQDGKDCFCGNDLQRNIVWKTSDTACSTTCQGYTSTSSPSCGGPGAVSIYGAVCTPGTYGANCHIPCRCEDAKECGTTGICPNNRCQPGYTYSFTSLRCEIPCTFAQFGSNCEGRCYCRYAVDCDKETGKCPGGCQIGFHGLNCSLTYAERYLGCFIDNPIEPLFSWWEQNYFNQTSAEGCMEICFRNGFKYAALTDGDADECRCGNSGFGLYGLSEDCYNCTRGSHSFICAPRASMVVYKTLLSPAPSDLRHVGCWTGANITEMLDPASLTLFEGYANLTVDYCSSECAKRGYKYAGLQAREDCHCSNNLRPSTHHGPSSPSDCNKPCLGGDIISPACGGPLFSETHMSVYRAECMIGKWGADCELSCNCWEGQSCHNVIGTCPLDRCTPGWLLSADRTCSQRCDSRKFGFLCLEYCHCAKKTGCNNVNGHCDLGYCEPGYKTISCSLECSAGVYGQNCSRVCNCVGASDCNHVTGVCATSQSRRSLPSLELLTFSLISLFFMKTHC